MNIQSKNRSVLSDFFSIAFLLMAMILSGCQAETKTDSDEQSNNNTAPVIDENHRVAVCASEGAQCGVVRDKSGNSISCGSCDGSETCSNNRCETSCSLNQIDDGPFDGLFAYVPTQFAYEDQSENQHSVNTKLLPRNYGGEFPFESAVDMKAKKMEMDFGEKTLSLPLTISFKAIANEKNQTDNLLNTNLLSVDEINGQLQVKLTNNQVTVLNDKSNMKSRSCNHIAVRLTENEIKTSFNGHAVSKQANLNSIGHLAGSLSLGEYEGRIWDIRVFDNALNDSDIKKLGKECDDAQDMVVENPEFPNYLCGVYQCMYWPANVEDTTMDSFEYQLSGHDMTWEHNVMDTGMYVHGALCAEYEKSRNLELTDGYRKSWVSKFNFENPWNQYVLHENFHAYQKRTGGSTKFLAESSASWGAFTMKPTAYDTLLGMYTLQPHLALWTKQDSVFEDGIIDYSKGGHQYGASIFEWYVTHYVLADNAMGKVFNRDRFDLAPLTGSPAEAFYNVIKDGGYDMREVFVDFAARITTWDVDYGDTFLKSEIGSFNRMNGNNKKSDSPIPDEEVDNKISVFYDENGTKGNWVAVPARYKVSAWAFNAYEVSVDESVSYKLGINPSTNNPDYAEFRAKAVVYNEATGERRYTDLPVTSAGIAVTTNVIAHKGEKLYLIVASTPSTKFTDYEAYAYDYLIEKQ